MVIGSKLPPDPFKPLEVIERISLISKSCLSTITSLISPFTTGWTNAVVPDPADTSINGGLITSKLDPPDNTSTFSIGP